MKIRNILGMMALVAGVAALPARAAGGGTQLPPGVSDEVEILNANGGYSQLIVPETGPAILNGGWVGPSSTQGGEGWFSLASPLLPPNFPGVTIELTEQGLLPGQPGYISDILVAAGGSFYFASDDENGNFAAFPFGAALPPVVAQLAETGSLQDVSPFLGLGLPNGDVLVASDIDVPEPGTYGVMAGAGLLALSLFRARKAIKMT